MRNMYSGAGGVEEYEISPELEDIESKKGQETNLGLRSHSSR
jgi:hypothetical protein